MSNRLAGPFLPLNIRSHENRLPGKVSGSGSKVEARLAMGALLIACLAWSPPLLAGEVVRAGRWELHNSFWINLHEALMRDASPKAPTRQMRGVPDLEVAAWQRAVEAYRAAAGPGSITFSRPMMALQDDLTQVADDAKVIQMSGPLADALRGAAPVYRKHWWPSDQASNRFLIGYLAAMLRDVGAELASAHGSVYGVAFPEVVRVDVAGWAGIFGAYTHDLLHAGTVVTIASRDSGNHGLVALELVVHETSHAVVGPQTGPVAEAIFSAAKERGRQVPADLWHAILFATSSELTRKVLAERGISGYIPMSADLLTRAWPQYRVPIETHWYPYLNGKGTLAAAIEGVVATVP